MDVEFCIIRARSTPRHSALVPARKTSTGGFAECAPNRTKHIGSNQHLVTQLSIRMPRLNKRAQREQDALSNLQEAAPDGLILSNEEQSGSEPETRLKLGFAAVCPQRVC